MDCAIPLPSVELQQLSLLSISTSTLSSALNESPDNRFERCDSITPVLLGAKMVVAHLEMQGTWSCQRALASFESCQYNCRRWNGLSLGQLITWAAFREVRKAPSRVALLNWLHSTPEMWFSIPGWLCHLKTDVNVILISNQVLTEDGGAMGHLCSFGATSDRWQGGFVLGKNLVCWLRDVELIPVIVVVPWDFFFPGPHCDSRNPLWQLCK